MEKGKLSYRGYDATELAAKLSFEEVAYLLWHAKQANRKRAFSDFREKLAKMSIALSGNQ